MRTRRMHRVLQQSALCAALVYGSATAAYADQCSGLGKDEAAICTAAVQQLDKIHALKSPQPQCALDRVAHHLNSLIDSLATLKQPVVMTMDFAVVTNELPSAAKVRSLFFADADEVLIALEKDTDAPAGSCFVDKSNPVGSALLDIAAAVQSEINRHNLPALEKGALGLRRLSDTWQWVVTDGFGAFPWERFVSDALDHSPVSPFNLPKYQIILGHPSIGAEVSGGSRWADLRTHPSFFIEPIGFVRYNFNVLESSRSYWGASALVVLNSDDTPALGALLRFNKFALGGAYHFADNKTGRTSRWSVTATVELIERLQSASKRAKQAADEARALALPAAKTGG